jgi:hypothetical protein
MFELIAKLGFQRAGSIRLDSAASLPVFELLAEYRASGAYGAHQGWVYLWCHESPGQPLKVVYVGKAGKALEQRCRQHVGGFRGGSKKGVENARSIRQALSADAASAMHLYARMSPTAEILGEGGVSLCEAEERAMILKLRRLGQTLWNAPSD